ncbi:hypothetical protein BH11MYX3_BH11MYX3_18660 [soil metagenome]
MLNKLKIAIVAGAVLIGGVAAAQGTDKPDHQARKAQMIEKFDANHDGTLDEAEKQAMKDMRAAHQFQRLDKDGNGLLSIEEFKAGHGHHGRRGGHGKMRGERGER